jgi:hypothetical protein
MDAGKLHSWVWESAAPLWRTKHFSRAVSQAAIRVNAETQAKVGRRDITETDLFNQVFSLDEPKIEGSVTRPTRPVDWAAGPTPVLTARSWCRAPVRSLSVVAMARHRLPG